MIPYYLLYAYLSLNSLYSKKFSVFTGTLTFLILLIFIGFRHEIGVDWIQYLNIMYEDTYLKLIKGHEIGYNFFNWVGSELDSIYIVNSLSAIVFLSGLFAFCKRQPYPWFTLIFAFPVLLLPVALGLTRQSCAVGIEFFALNAVEDQKIIKAIILIIFAITFHFSALFLLTIFIPDILKNRFKFQFVFLLAIVSIFAYYSYDYFAYRLAGYNELYNTDLGHTWVSKGALPRILPSLLATLILIFNKDKFASVTNKISLKIYSRIGYCVLLFFVLMIYVPFKASILDRFAIYFVPITMFVFNRTMDLRLFKISKYYYQLIFLSYYFFQSFLWLETAAHKASFVPYKNILFL